MTNHLWLGSHYTQRAASGATSIDGARLRPLLASCSLAALLVGGGAPAAHAACYTGPFPYTNTGSSDCIVVNNATVSGNLVNGASGTITASGVFSPGITVSNSSIGGSVINAGNITAASGTGILTYNATVSGGISNSGTISAGDGILVGGDSFSGGISNSGTISAGGYYGIVVGGAVTVSSFSGGINNSGTISAGVDGILVGGGTVTVSSFSGGISNSGMISAGAYGIVVGSDDYSNGVSVISGFSGGISNSGTISAGNSGGPHGIRNPGGNGIWVGGGAGTSVTISTFSGGISNSGTISAALGVGLGNGILVGGSNGFVQLPFSVTISAFSDGIGNSGTISAASSGIWIGGDLTNGSSVTISSFSGGISNSGTISAGFAGIRVGGNVFINAPSVTISAFNGGINNSGSISAGLGGSGIWVGGIALDGGSVTISTFSGGISNSGTISAGSGGNGIWVGGDAFFGASVTISTFSGGISNSGTILAGGTGIKVDHVMAFADGITNSGTISAATGISVSSASPVGVFDSGVIVGTSGTAVDLSGNAAGNSFTLGPGYSITGLVKGQGSDTFQLGGTGSGAFNLSNIGTQYTGFTAFNVVGGVWTATGVFGQSQAWNVDGGTLAGTGTFNAVNVNAGGTLAPGTSMTINGSLTLQSAAVYMVTLNGVAASRANVSGTATIASGARFAVAGGSTPVVNSTYTVLAASGGVTGTFTNQDVVFGIYRGVLSYTGDDVDLTVRYNSLLPLLPPNPPVNVVNVATAIDAAIQSGVTPPAGFANLFNLSPSQLQYGLTQLSGEAATAAGKGADQLMTHFLELMLDPTAGGGGISGGGAARFAPEQDTTLPADVALAYAKALKAPQSNAPQSFDQRWTVWGAAFGGASHTDGNAALGSNNVTASDYGFAAGMERHFTPDTVYGFGLAGGGTNWTLAQALGSGRSDAFQAGLYTKTHWGPLYLSGALAFANHWFTTDRIALGDQLRATFTGQSYAARGEAGYRYAVPVTGAIIGVTPYAALQAQGFRTPSYTETDLTGGGFGLSYASANATDTRSELGMRFDNLQVVNGMPLVLRGRFAWAHDWYTNATALNAAFQALPGSNFTVNGAAPPKDSALTTAAAELHITQSWTAIVKFDGDFGAGAQTYGGTGTLRYSW
ncbi:autotransporter domain-containing protein [Bradyrhizobium sp. NAS96.2]|uniref:autotransporter outer membrane beta-barrel domain-containing protein n=1 Tax=Bradyrhizobium sp. NAS96.2 TaxID=1680160 RepID=UPI000B3173AC|nr:autotransporter domain-containing protein [Bradyrhizobium sp. NAS96.2]